MRQFYKVLNRLKKLLPTTHPVLVYIVKPDKIKGRYGEAYFTGKRHIIRIAKGDWHLLKFVLLHEYAHCLTPNVPEKEWHGKEWGNAYSLCWKVYTGE
jgi:hypothetical protein